MKQLKSCPFCGGSPTQTLTRSESIFSHNMVDTLTIRCDACDYIFGSSEQADDLRSRWNRRMLFPPKPYQPVTPHWHGRRLTCQTCGQTFEQQHPQVASYCSAACRNHAARRRRKERTP